MSKATEKKENQEWASEKPKLDNAQKLRGIHFIDPEDGEYKETIKHRKKEIVTSDGGSHSLQDGNKKALEGTAARGIIESNRKTKDACVVEAHESTRKRLESAPGSHEDHIVGKGFSSTKCCNLVHTFIPMPKTMNSPDAKAAVEARKLASVEIG